MDNLASVDHEMSVFLSISGPSRDLGKESLRLQIGVCLGDVFISGGFTIMCSFSIVLQTLHIIVNKFFLTLSLKCSCS